MAAGKWFLFTARPEDRAAAVVEACTAAEGPEPIVVRDEKRLGIGPMMDRVYCQYPDLDFYGWLADDTFPESPGWAAVLEEEAGLWGLSYANDGGYLSPGGGPADGAELTTGLCWGGELLRCAHSWSLGFHTAWIDVAWITLLQPLDLLRYCPEVVVRHDNWRTGRREKDNLDRIALDRIDVDRVEFYGWQQQGGMSIIRQRIEGGIAACAY